MLAGQNHGKGSTCQSLIRVLRAKALHGRVTFQYTRYTTYRNRTRLQHEWNILHEELVQLYQCREQLNKQLISYQSIPSLPDIVDSASPKLVVSAKSLPLSCRPTDSRQVICHVRQECITLRCRIDGLPSLIASVNHRSNPLRYLTLVRPRQSWTDPRSLTKLELEAAANGR